MNNLQESILDAMKVFVKDSTAKLNFPLTLECEIIKCTDEDKGEYEVNYLDNHFVATSEKEGDYFSCNFAAIANAYGIKGIKLADVKDLSNCEELLTNGEAVLFEIEYEDCPANPGIVAGGEFLKKDTGISDDIIEKINQLMSL